MGPKKTTDYLFLSHVMSCHSLQITRYRVKPTLLLDHISFSTLIIYVNELEVVQDLLKTVLFELKKY